MNGKLEVMLDRVRIELGGGVSGSSGVRVVAVVIVGKAVVGNIVMVGVGRERSEGLVDGYADCGGVW